MSQWFPMRTLHRPPPSLCLMLGKCLSIEGLQGVGILFRTPSVCGVDDNEDCIEGLGEVENDYFLARSSIVAMSCVSDEWPERKPWLRWVRMLFSSNWDIIDLLMICSRMFDRTDVSETGR